jgi:CBS domain containing-hemolysin-like protein
MQPRSNISALSYSDIEHATVGDIIDTLRCSGERHCLVVDDEHHWIRGLIAASDIALRLHIEFDFASPPSFADILAVVNH